MTTMIIEEFAKELNTMVRLKQEDWELLLLSSLSPYAPNVLINGVTQRGVLHANMIGEISTAKSLYRTEPIIYIDGKTKMGIKESIGELVDKQLEVGNKTVINNDTEITYDNPDNIMVPSFNMKTWKNELKRVKAFMRHKSPKNLIKITTGSGRTITATPDHTFIVPTEDGIAELKLNDIIVGDFIPIVKNMPHLGNKTHDEIFGKLDKECGYFFGMFFAEGNVNSDNTADNPSGISITQKNHIILKRLQAFLKTRNIISHLDEKYHVLKIHSVEIGKYFRACVKRTGKGKGKNIKKFPDWFYSAPIEFYEGVLEGYIEGDGWTESKASTICYILTKDKKLSDGLIYAMNVMGVYPKIQYPRNIKYNRTYYKLVILGDSLKKLNNIIKLNKSIKNIVYYRREYIPFGATYLYERIPSGSSIRGSNTRDIVAELRSIISHKQTISKTYLKKVSNIFNINIDKYKNMDIYWDKIKSIENIKGEGYVYDIEVEDNNTFVGGYGNIIVHNSSIIRIIQQISPKFARVSKTTNASIEGTVTPGNIIVKGVIEQANDGVLFVPEYNKKLSKLDIMREVMDGDKVTISKRAISWDFTPNVAFIAGSNPKQDFFIKGATMRNEIPFAEGILSRFDVIIPMINTPDETEHIVNEMSFFGMKTKKVDMRKIKSRYHSLAESMRELVKNVTVTDEQAKALKEAYLTHNVEMGNRPRVILRDMGSLIRLVNVITCINAEKKIVQQVYTATDADIDKAIDLWSYLINVRIQMYEMMNEKDIKDTEELVYDIIKENDTIPNKELIKKAKGLCSKRTIFRIIKRLEERGEIKRVKPDTEEASVSVI